MFVKRISGIAATVPPPVPHARVRAERVLRQRVAAVGIVIGLIPIAADVSAAPLPCGRLYPLEADMSAIAAAIDMF